MNVNLDVLSDLTKRMTEGERVKPETEEEKLCFKLIMTWIMSMVMCLGQSLRKNI